MKQYRQGDVFLIEIDSLPSFLKEKKDKVLAYGEVTGHSHQFEDKNVKVLVDSSGQQYVQVEKDSNLIHEEHKEITIPTGIYKVVLQRELDLQQQVRDVLD
jgi:hypothetical protein